MSPSRPTRPLFPPLPLDPISDNCPSDIISRDSSSSDSESESIAKRARMLGHAESYLRGEQLYLHSARLRGPVVNNPWRKRGRQIKRKPSDVEGGVSKRLKRGEEWESAQVRSKAVEVGRESRGINTTFDTSTPSTPTPLRTRPPEATNVPDRAYSPSRSPFWKEILEFKTPVKKKPKNPIEVAAAFSPRTFYSGPKPSQLFTKAPNRRGSLSAKKSSLPEEARVSASRSRSRSAPKATKEDQARQPLETRGSSLQLRSSQESAKEPTSEMPRVSSLKPRSTRNFTKESEPELPGELHSATRPRSTRNSTKILELELSQEPHSISKPGSTRRSTKTPELQLPLGREELEQGQEPEEKQGQESEQGKALDTTRVALPAPLRSGIEVKSRRPKVDFGEKSPLVIAPERLKVKGRKKKRGAGKEKEKRLEEVQRVGKEASSEEVQRREKGERSEEAQGGGGTIGSVDTERLRGLQVEAVLEAESMGGTERVGVDDVPEPEHGPEKVEDMSKDQVLVAEDVRVSAVAELEHVPGNVEAISKEPTVVVAIQEPEKAPETPFPSTNLVREQVLESLVNHRIAASQGFTTHNIPINKFSIADLLAPMVGSPVTRRDANVGMEDGVPYTPINRKAVTMVPNTPAVNSGTIGIVGASTLPLLPSGLGKHRPTPSPHAATINPPLGDASEGSPTQFDPTNPQPETQQDSWQSTQCALLAAQKGFFDAIQESPVVFGPYLSTTVTPGRDLLKPVSFFESQTPRLVSSFGGGGPIKTPGMESVQWTTESLEGEEESPLKTPGRPLSPLKLSFGGDDSLGAIFTPFRDFATPESSPKATSQQPPPPTFPPLKQLTQAPSTIKKSDKLTDDNRLGILDDEDEQEDNTASFDSGFSPIIREAGQGAEGLVEEVMEFMSGGVWDIDEELRKMADGSTTTPPSGKGRTGGSGSGKRRTWAKRQT